MAYIGTPPSSAVFPFDQFSGDGTTVSFTLSYAPAGTTTIIVYVYGILQNPNTYAVVGTVLTFTGAPPAGTNNIGVLYLGLPVVGTTNPGNSAYRTATDYTATSGQTTFATSTSYTPGYIEVYRNGVRLGAADYTATNGTTVTLNNACSANDLVTVIYFTLTTINLINALSLSGGTVTGNTTFGSYLTVTSNLTVGGNISTTGNLTVSSVQASNITSTANITAVNVIVSGTANSVSSTTGALTVVGGAGIAGNVYSGNAVNDTKGELRAVPVNVQTTTYIITSTDHGKYISTNSGVTVPSGGVFAPGQNVTIYNDSGSSIAITQGSGVTMYVAGTSTTGNRTLALRGLCTIFCVGTDTFVISGGGLS